MKKLPKMYGGVALARGKGVNYKTIDKLVGEQAWSGDEWPRGEFYVVTADRKDDTDLRDGKVFSKLDDATKYARSCGNGNVDHRVLRCTNELLVIATRNEL